MNLSSNKYHYVDTPKLDVTGQRSETPTKLIRFLARWPLCSFVHFSVQSRSVRAYFTHENFTKQDIYSRKQAKTITVDETEPESSLPCDTFLFRDFQAIELFDLLCLEKRWGNFSPTDFEDLYRSTKLRASHQRANPWIGHAVLFRLLIKIYTETDTNIPSWGGERPLNFKLSKYAEYARKEVLPTIGDVADTQFYVGRPREASVTIPHLLYWLGILAGPAEQYQMETQLNKYVPAWREHIKADWRDGEEIPFAYKVTRNFTFRNHLIDNDLQVVDRLTCERAAKILTTNVLHYHKDKPMLPRTLELVAKSDLGLNTYLDEYHKSVGQLINEARETFPNIQQYGQWLTILLRKHCAQSNRAGTTTSRIPSI